MTSSHNGTSRPFTVALCTSCAAGPELAVVEELRATIRRCKHGVLVTTACMLDPLTCAARPHRPGTIVILQPCSVDRVPSGPACRIGPINDKNDVRALRDWLEQGEWITAPRRTGCAQNYAGPTALVETDDRSERPLMGGAFAAVRAAPTRRQRRPPGSSLRASHLRV
jgi:hypothetical protein